MLLLAFLSSYTSIMFVSLYCILFSWLFWYYCRDLDNPDYGIIREEQATLKIDRDLSTSLGDQRVGGVEHARDIINLSQQSLDRVSQLSPELDISDEEMSNLLADVWGLVLYLRLW